jgi:2-polyprenyl-3-methyl-5-hydroxy-6-metoxy-1,4-benzoquinol methylase
MIQYVGAMDNYLTTNQRHWNDVTPQHVASESYDVASFKAGGNTLRSVELDELGNVAGRSLLHLQCHFGMDTLSWARRGADVTGVDFAQKAVETARSLAAELGIKAEFICSNVYDLPQALNGQFDIVFTSYGVLAWLPDLTKWAEVIAHFLKPGGVFFIAESHPFADSFETEGGNGRLVKSYPYFANGQPLAYECDCTYAGAVPAAKATFEWSHSLGEVIDSLIGAGLRIEHLHEFAFCMYRRFSCMAMGEDGWWRLPEAYGDMPMLFSVKAVRE